MLGESKSYFDRHAWPSMNAEARTVPVVEVTVTMWSDPLDFHRVPTVEEAVTRVNAAGFFILTPNRDIYKIKPDGGISLWRKWNFDFFLANRLARYGKGKLISAGSAWKRSGRRCEYDRIGY